MARSPQVPQQELIAQQSDSDTADASFQRGWELFEEGTAESLRAAISYFEEAARLYEQGGNPAKQATAQMVLGRVYNDFWEKQQALEYYEQALPLFQAVGDRQQEATTLNNIGKVYDALGEKQKAIEFDQQSLVILQEIGFRDVEKISLGNLGIFGRRCTAREPPLLCRKWTPDRNRNPKYWRGRLPIPP
ncbi:tetratricopeptide repeat protein [Lyngbya sp. CCY1209]|uniref:tetratricopeptide repeat protein n=1 Tax=Lyngbya sp. CCY1209 TaxID=2886103 RepID=UPI002D207252|nr:tetratricopeptide repeat protein [Lyngbya sp. CCY1209]MEB3887214.1 tetratricopeptide repeat protein [Lyngbya sp. CCY1209]